MPLDAQAQDFLRRLAAANLPSFEEQTVAQLRAQMNMSTHFLGELPRVAHVEDRRIPGPGGTLRVRTIAPGSRQRSAPDPCLFPRRWMGTG